MLGSRKFLIFGIVSALVLSLLIVVASAEDVVKQIDGGGLRSAFAPKYILNDSGIDDFARWVEDEGYTSSSPLYFSFTVYLYFQGHGVGVVEYVFVDNHIFYARYAGGNYQIGSNVRTLSVDSAADFEWFLSNTSVTYEDFDFSNTLDKVVGAGSTFFSALLGIGSSLISFVIARPIVLIPFVVMLGIFAIAVVRRFVKGV